VDLDAGQVVVAAAEDLQVLPTELAASLRTALERIVTVERGTSAVLSEMRNSYSYSMADRLGLETIGNRERRV
jgi:hypothetical protein